MNLQDSLTMSELRKPAPVQTKVKTKTRLQIARRVLQLAAQGGFPYKYHTAESWAKKHLPSKEFVLMEIDINAAASPHIPKNGNRVAYNLLCAAADMEPIVVDRNNRKEGSTLLGFIPDVIVKDGKHRKQARIMQGYARIMAWVGVKAAPKLISKETINASGDKDRYLLLPAVDNTRMAATYEIHASTVPSVGLSKSVMRQDSGEGGSRPVDSTHPMSAGKLKGKIKTGGGAAGGASNGGGSGSNPLRMGVMGVGKPGARSSGSLEDTDSSDDTIPPDASDTKQAVDASDRLKFNPNKPQIYTPGTSKGHGNKFGSPNLDSPGSGVGPRTVNKGPSRSEMAKQLNAKCGSDCLCMKCGNGKKIDRMKVKRRRK